MKGSVVEKGRSPMRAGKATGGVAEADQGLGFEQAVARVIGGQAMTRRFWDDPSVFVTVANVMSADRTQNAGRYLAIRLQNGEVHAYSVPEVDLAATDWVPAE